MGVAQEPIYFPHKPLYLKERKSKGSIWRKIEQKRGGLQILILISYVIRDRSKLGLIVREEARVTSCSLPDNR